MSTFPVSSAITIAPAASATDVLAWPITSTLATIESGTRLSFPHSKAGQWPLEYPPIFDERAAVEGNLWAVCLIGTTWVAGTIEWLRPGQTEKQKPASEYGEAFGGAYAHYAGPQPGELVGYFVSTMARGGQRSRLNERSNILWTHYGTRDLVGIEGDLPLRPEGTVPMSTVSGIPMQAGDCLVYTASSWIGTLIAFKTWDTNRASHVEIVWDDLSAIGARPEGVSKYAIRTADLIAVMRPDPALFSLGPAKHWYTYYAHGAQYDGLGLLRFYTVGLPERIRRYVPSSADKLFCSELATRFYRAGGLNPFHHVDDDLVPPGWFITLADGFTEVWRR